MKKPLPVSAPSAMGVDASAISRYIDAINRDAEVEFHGLVILKRGHVIADACWSPYKRQEPTMLFSLSKSFTSTAIGFCVQEGRLALGDKVLGFFPDDAPKDGEFWGDMTVHHLLSMNTGHDQDPTGAVVSTPDGDWVRAFFAQPLSFQPGTHFTYNTAATYLLSVIVQKLTGQTVLEYLTTRLFDPLGIEDASWECCPKGYNTGGFGLSITTDDIARFGQFCLQRGAWDGQQLLNAAWIDAASSAHSDNAATGGTLDWGSGYGYQFWRCVPEGVYRGDGAFGQYCVVMPELEAVVAITSGVQNMQTVLTLLWDILMPGLTGGVASDAAADAELSKQLEKLVHAPPLMMGHSMMEPTISTMRYQLDENPEQLDEISFRFDGNLCTVSATASGSTTSLAAGRERWEIGFVSSAFLMMSRNPEPIPIASSFTWTPDAELKLTIRATGTPFVFTLTCAFTPDSVKITRDVNASFGDRVSTYTGKGVRK